jgi:hypothetical protein
MSLVPHISPENATMAATSEMLLALRNPDSGWLATLIIALAEAQADPGFTSHHQALFADLCQGQPISPVLRAAALQRSLDFERRLAREEDGLAAAG